jgi:hypothetical protein
VSSSTFITYLSLVPGIAFVLGHQMIHSPSNILGSYASSFPVKSWPTVVNEIIISVRDTKSWSVRPPLTSCWILQCRCSTRRSIIRLAKIEFRTRAGLLLFNPRRKLRNGDVQCKHVLIQWWLKFSFSLDAKTRSSGDALR